MEQTDQQPVISLKLNKVAALRLQMCDWTASTVVFLEFRDMEIQWEYSLWEITKVLEPIGPAVSALR